MKLVQPYNNDHVSEIENGQSGGEFSFNVKLFAPKSRKKKNTRTQALAGHRRLGDTGADGNGGRAGRGATPC